MKLLPGKSVRHWGRSLRNRDVRLFAGQMSAIAMFQQLGDGVQTEMGYEELLLRGLGPYDCDGIVKRSVVWKNPLHH